jgi:hypothetical protein
MRRRFMWHTTLAGGFCFLHSIKARVRLQSLPLLLRDIPAKCGGWHLE